MSPDEPNWLEKMLCSHDQRPVAVANGGEKYDEVAKTKKKTERPSHRLPFSFGEMCGGLKFPV
jgi:hypothetical protein